MKSYLFGAVSVISLLAAGSASAHDDDSGWYLRGNAGYGIHEDPELSGGIDSSLHGNGLQSEGDGAFTLGAGYDFGDHWRLEADVDSLRTSLGSISQTPSSSGSLLTESVMLNALYDFDDFGKFEPYVGAGIGIVDTKGSFAAHDFTGTAGELVLNPTCVGNTPGRDLGQGATCGISDSDRGFGWQLLAGLGYELTDNLTWDTHYTYLNAPSANLEGHIANLSTGAFEFFDADLDDVAAHTLVTGLRYKFGNSHTHEVPKPKPVEPSFTCWDDSVVFNSSQCPVQEVIATPRHRHRNNLLAQMVHSHLILAHVLSFSSVRT